MASKPESRLQRRIQEALREAFPGCVFYKIHGNEFQVIGIPDLIGCVDGQFVAIEVKRPGEKPTEAQEYELARIKRAGGIAEIVTSPARAVELVRAAVTRAKTRR